MFANMTTMNFIVKGTNQEIKSGVKNTASHNSISIVNTNSTYYKEKKILIKFLDIAMYCFCAIEFFSKCTKFLIMH